MSLRAMRSWILLGATLASACSQGATTATPGGALDAAREKFRRGTALYGNGDYAGALSEFEAAYAIAPADPLLFNIAMCDERLGRDAAALSAYERYLAANADAQLQGPRNAEVEKKVEALRAKLGKSP